MSGLNIALWDIKGKKLGKNKLLLNHINPDDSYSNFRQVYLYGSSSAEKFVIESKCTDGLEATILQMSFVVRKCARNRDSVSLR